MRGKIGDKERFGHILIHEYFGVDSNLVWQVIRNDIPNLKAAINTIYTGLV